MKTPDTQVYYPCTHENGCTDKRYTIQKEYCGQSEAQFVARFCGYWIGHAKFYQSAVMLAVGHNNARKGSPIITALEK